MITERAMLAAVHISVWTAIKHDRKVSREVAEQHGAHASAGRYNKQLLREGEWAGPGNPYSKNHLAQPGQGTYYGCIVPQVAAGRFSSTSEGSPNELPQ